MSERHATRSDTIPDPDGTEGYWCSLCLSCGWEKEGRYPPAGEAQGLELAHLMGELHETAEIMRGLESRG